MASSRIFKHKAGDMMDTNLAGFLTQGNLFILGGLALLGLALLTLVLSINAFVSARMKKSRAFAARRRRLSVSGFTLQILLSLVFLFFALSVFFAGAVLRSYTVFNREDLVGRVECLQCNAGEKTLVVRFVPIATDQEQHAQTYSLPGDQWEVNARILKWTPKANLLGLHTAYRLNLIKGIYQNAEDESTRPHQAYALSVGQDWVWTLLSRYGKYLPFVEAVYGNAVSDSVEPGGVYEIFVTTSGLSAKKR